MVSKGELLEFKEAFKKSKWGTEADSPHSSKSGVEKVGFLQSFLQRMRLIMMLRAEDSELARNILDPDRLEEIQNKLLSQDKSERMQGLELAKELLDVNDQAAKKSADPNISAADLVEKLVNDDSQRGEIKVLAKELDKILLSSEDGGNRAHLNDKQCAEIYAKLRRLEAAVGGGYGEQGIEVLHDRVERIRAMTDYAQTQKMKEFMGDVQVNKYSKHFETVDPKKDDLIKFRVKKVKAETRELLRRVRKNAKEEIFGEGAKENIKKITDDEVVGRLGDVSELMAKYGLLHGGKLSPDENQELESVLNMVRDRYERELVARISKECGNRGVQVDSVILETAVRAAVDKQRLYGSAKYKFEKGDYAKIARKSLDIAKSIENRTGKVKSPEFVQSRQLDPEAEMMGQRRAGREQYLNELINRLNEMLVGSNYHPSVDDLLTLTEADGVEKILEQMRAQGVTNTEGFRTILEGMRQFRVDSSFDEISMLGELTASMKAGDYAGAMNLVMEYIARIGLSETNSDFKIVFMLRQLKDRLSLANPDAAAAFDAHKLLRYLPGLNQIPPEKFGEFQARVGDKSVQDYLTGPDNIFMMAARVDFGDGKVEQLSTARMLSALRSEKYAYKLLGARVNSTDSTLDLILLQELFGPEARINVDERGMQFLSYVKDGKQMSWYLDDKEKMVTLSFSEIDVRKKGEYGKWRKNGIQMTLRQMMDRNHWMSQDALQVWWYSRAWEGYLRHYPRHLMENAPKSLAAVGAMLLSYQANFENVARPMMDIAELGTQLGPLEVYKSADMVGRRINDVLLRQYKKDPKWEADRMWQLKQKERAQKVAALFARNMVNRKTVVIGDKDFTFDIDILSREQLRLVGNKIDPDNVSEVGKILIERMRSQINEEDVPSIDELEKYYLEWSRLKDKREMRPLELSKSDSESDRQKKMLENDRRMKVAFWGTEYETMREIIKQRKFNREDQALWDSLSMEELDPVLEIEAKVTGKKREIKSLDDFWSGAEHGALVDWSKSVHRDDAEQYGGKYYHKEVEAAKLWVKIMGLRGTKEDLVALDEIMAAYVPANQRRIYNEALLHAIHRAESWQTVPYEMAAKKPHAESPNAIDWITLRDSNNQTIYARTVIGGRAYYKEKYLGNYAWWEMGHDLWRDSDFEIMTDYFVSKGDIDFHRKHEMDESILGVHTELNWLAEKFGLKGERKKEFVKKYGKWISKAKIFLKKHPLFDDPKWAIYMLFKESWEFVKETGGEITKGVAGGH